jgi:F-type H+-transporting ATPase subunit a
VNFFSLIADRTHVPWYLWSALFAALVFLATSALLHRHVSRAVAADGGLIPEAGFTLRNVFEVLVEFVAGFCEEAMGHHWRRYFPFIATLFFYILFANLLGLIPGLRTSTSDGQIPWSFAALSFIVFQYAGIREHGWSYLYHYLGPSLFDVTIRGRTYHVRALAPLYGPIEIIGQLARMLSLSVRLLANMFADHTIVGIWVLLVPPIVPAIFMGMGVLVAFLQAYVFALLSAIYIGLAVEEAH